MPDKVVPYSSISMFDNTDLATIWYAVEQILAAVGASATPVGAIVQNVKIFPSTVPADASQDLVFTLSDLGIGKYIFIPKSLSLILDVGAVGGNRTLQLLKFLDGFPVNLLCIFGNQGTPQIINTQEQYFFTKDNETEIVQVYSGNTIHNLNIPESFALRFNGGANNDFMQVHCNNGNAVDTWVSALGQPIVLCGDIMKIQD